MRSLGTRRVALFTGAVTVAAVALTGCSAGQVAETSLKVPSNQGVNTANETGSVLIRNLSVGYNGTAGYQRGTDAPIEVNLYNRTNGEITVRVSSGAPDPGAPATGVVTATQIGLKGSAPSASTGASSPATASSPGTASSTGTAPSPSAAESAAPAAQPAELTISPMGNVTFRPGDSQTLEAIGLNGKLQPGGQLSLVFEFSDGSPTLKVLAPIASPLTPAPRASGNPNENAEE